MRQVMKPSKVRCGSEGADDGNSCSVGGGSTHAHSARSIFIMTMPITMAMERYA